MALTENSGSTLADGTEQTLWDVTALSHYAGWVYLHNMASGDTLVIKISVYDSNAAAYRLYDTWTYTGAQTNTAVFIPYISAPRYKVTIQQTAGTNRTYTWARHVA